MKIVKTVPNFGKKKNASMTLPAFTVMEGFCGRSHVPTEEPHHKEKNAWNLNSVSRICSGPGIGKRLVFEKCIDKGRNRI